MANIYLQSICMPCPTNFKIYQKGNEWNEVFNNISQKPGCAVLAGGKGVGKSTMLRFLVNRYLSSGTEGVLVIDLDPGQSELTVPGCISATIVKKPLLGPSYYNQQDPLKCFYVGDVNILNCVLSYIDACLAIASYLHSQEHLKTMPCLVNTMGFSEEGLGVSLMVHILSMLQPSFVIQIQSKFQEVNFPILSDEFVKKNYVNSPFREKLMAQGQQLICPSDLSYSLHIVNSNVTTSKNPLNPSKASIKASRLNRELSVMSYISKLVVPPNTSLLQAIPYCCSLDSLHLHVCHENVSPSVTLPAFNGSLVALCCIDSDKQDVLPAAEPGLPSLIKGPLLADCMGFGIVRGIDMDNRKLYLLTPVSPSVLSSINCLVLGSVNLPSCVYLSPPKVTGYIPYVIAKQKSFLPTYFHRSN